MSNSISEIRNTEENPLAFPHKEDTQVVNWIFSVRIILSICLIYYHNHRLFDMYRHNMSIQLDFDEDVNLLVGVRATQRAVLQAGLNLFMFLAGCSLYCSMVKRRSKHGQILQERIIKLILGFLFGLVMIAIPANFFILYCGREFSISEFGWDDFFSLLEPGHITFLPYLFFLTEFNMPYLKISCIVGTLKISEFPSSSKTTHISNFLYYSSILYLIAIGISLRYSTRIYIYLLFLAVMTVFSRYHPQLQLKSILQRITLYFRLCDLTSSHLLTLFMLPLFFSFYFSYIFADYDISSLGVIMLYILPAITCFLPVSIQLTQKLPHFYINTRLVALLCITLSQLVVIASPEAVPPNFAEGETEALLGGYLSKKMVFGNIIMFIGHSSFFAMGFYWMLFEKDLPNLPISNIGVIAMSCYYIFFKPIYLLPSKDFLYLTAGYVTYHGSIQRFWYHFGGWSWVYTVVISCKYIGNFSYESPGIEGKILRFLRDATFGTFLCHPLFGYIIGCFLIPLDISVTYKIILLDIGVYFWSYLWVYAVHHFAIIRRMFGVKG